MKDNKGFTLVEVLIALTILSLLVTVVFMGFRVSSRCWERGRVKLDELQTIRMGLEILQRTIRAGYPYYAKDDEDTILWFSGDEDSLTFVSSQTSFATENGLTLIKFEIRESEEEKKELMIYQAPSFTISSYQEFDDDNVFALIPEIGKISFSYYGSKEETEEEGKWYDKWAGRDEKKLPQAVKCNLEAYGESWEVLIPIIVAGVQSSPSSAPNSSSRIPF